MIKDQFKLENAIVKDCKVKFKRELELAKASATIGNTLVGTTIVTNLLASFSQAIDKYLADYAMGQSVRSTLAAQSMQRLGNIQVIALIAAKVIMNFCYVNHSVQSLYRNIGQAIEDEWKMQEFKKKNPHYYKITKNDLEKRGAKPYRLKTVLNHVFSNQLNFQLESWNETAKVQTGMVLTRLFAEATELIEFDSYFEKGKHKIQIVPTQEALRIIENLNDKLAVLHPQQLPMVCKPNSWSGVLGGGYVSPYFKRNKLIKNNSKAYLQKLQEHNMPNVYSAINHIQNTAWQINSKILDIITSLWSEGVAIAGLPDREDTPIPPYPLPNKTKDDVLTEADIKVKKAWKAEAYGIHKQNVQKRSLRILTAQILRIAQKFKEYEKIYFPYQMDFRGRLYPIPVLLQPQGSDLAKGLLRFAEGKPIYGDTNAIKWLKIHGANMFGYDKASYDERVKWVEDRELEICSFAENPIANRGWTEADKPFQFLAWCFEYAEFLKNPRVFETHIPIQLDGSCNGLQHFSALLKDEVAGKTVNLVDSSEPSDIYQKVADKLKNSLEKIKSTEIIASKWLELGFDRKLTKRPVMTLPYGVSEYGCRKFISDYLVENYSPEYLWKFFGIGNNPADCVFKVSLFLSKHLWQAIKSTLKSAIVGMDFLKKVAKIVNTNSDFIEWETPAGLLVRQAYQAQKKKVIRTELYGSIIRTTMNFDNGMIDKRKQLNGIAPNFIHSLDATCLMIYLNKCQTAGINSIMAVHDCYAVHATDTELSAKLLREAFVEIYRQPVLANFLANIKKLLPDGIKLPALPEMGKLDIEAVLDSKYFFN